MLRLLALAAHFSPFNPGPFDPEVVSLLNSYFEPEQAADNVVEIGGNSQKTAQHSAGPGDSKAA